MLAYLPPSLAALGPAAGAISGRRYPVLYFHDGQNVFDEATSTSGEWHARRVGGKGDAYLAFLTETVMPLVEDSFPVCRAREATGVIGSSFRGRAFTWTWAAANGAA